jgi:cytochrome c oxidase accessory protein FixG
MGIDIRDGLQLECITCALCIDACNDVMDKVNLPRGLISYDTHEGQFDSNPERKLKLRFIRPRTIAYGAMLALVGAIMLFTLLNRSVLDVNVIRDRNPLFVTLSDGSIRNGYTVKILNKVHETRQFRIDVEGIAGMTAWLEVSGETDRPLLVTVPADALSSYKLYVSAPAENLEEKSMDIDVIVTDVDGTERDVQETSFKGPEK